MIEQVKSLNKHNTYHTHTYRCKHASGEVIDYCRAAKKAGMKYIGITDHTPLPDNRWIGVRMANTDLDDYHQAILDAQEQVDGIRIFKAMECDYAKEYLNYFQVELIEKRHFEYLIGAIHFIPDGNDWISSFGFKNGDEILRYSDHFIEAIESKLFYFMAHPEIFAIPFVKWSNEMQQATENILSCAMQTGMPLELNAYGFRKPHHEFEDGHTLPTYPREEFWKTAQNYKIKTIINSDAHRPEDVGVGFDLAEEWVEKYQLETIELSDYLLGKKEKDW
ncbi:MAG: histidinol-phosphatase [Planctomycetota bacterium]|nr:MAG: histidinol-phosphatase [Planctomycetota bacterium]